MGPDFDGYGPFGGHGGPGGHGPGGFLPVVGALPLLVTLLVVLWFSGWGPTLLAAARAAVAPDPWRNRWAVAVDRHRAVSMAFAGCECDPRSILDRPALSDVGQPATAHFVDAFAEARALLTERYPAREVARLFADAVEREERAWLAAVDAAARIGAAVPRCRDD